MTACQPTPPTDQQLVAAWLALDPALSTDARLFLVQQQFRVSYFRLCDALTAAKAR